MQELESTVPQIKEVRRAQPKTHSTVCLELFSTFKTALLFCISSGLSFLLYFNDNFYTH